MIAIEIGDNLFIWNKRLVTFSDLITVSDVSFVRDIVIDKGRHSGS